VLTAQSGRTGHVIIGDCWWFDWLQGFVRSISSGQGKKRFEDRKIKDQKIKRINE